MRYNQWVWDIMPVYILAVGTTNHASSANDKMTTSNRPHLNYTSAFLHHHYSVQLLLFTKLSWEVGQPCVVPRSSSSGNSVYIHNIMFPFQLIHSVQPEYGTYINVLQSSHQTWVRHSKLVQHFRSSRKNRVSHRSGCNIQTTKL